MRRKLWIIFISFFVFSCNSNKVNYDNIEKNESQECISEEAGYSDELSDEEEIRRNENPIDNIVGMYQLDWGYASGQSGRECGIEILSDGRCLRYWHSDKLHKEYLGDVKMHEDGTFQILLTDRNNLQSIGLAYFHSGSDDEREGIASYWPNYNHSYPYSMLFERVGYGLCGYENVSAYRNRDISEYYYAKFYKVSSR